MVVVVVVVRLFKASDSYHMQKHATRQPSAASAVEYAPAHLVFHDVQYMLLVGPFSIDMQRKGS